MAGVRPWQEPDHRVRHALQARCRPALLSTTVAGGATASDLNGHGRVPFRAPHAVRTQRRFEPHILCCACAAGLTDRRARRLCGRGALEAARSIALRREMDVRPQTASPHETGTHSSAQGKAQAPSATPAGLAQFDRDLAARRKEALRGEPAPSRDTASNPQPLPSILAFIHARRLNTRTCTVHVHCINTSTGPRSPSWHPTRTGRRFQVSDGARPCTSPW